MRRRLNVILRWSTVTSYLLVMFAAHSFHSHSNSQGHGHDRSCLTFVSDGSAICSLTSRETVDVHCAHDHHHGCGNRHSHHQHDRHQHDEDECTICQFLAVNLLTVSIVAIPSPSGCVSPMTLPAVIRYDAPGLALPESRGPPRIAS